jgi:hypothetical protein
MPTLSENNTLWYYLALQVPMSKRKTIFLVVLAVFMIVTYTQVTFFVVQPIGAVPEGRTLVIWRTGRLKFIDSADGFCARESNGVSLLCRMAVLGTVAQNSTVIARLPYSETLYLISTDGNKYER